MDSRPEPCKAVLVKPFMKHENRTGTMIMNDVATQTTGRGLASLQGLKKGLQNVQATMPAKVGGDPYLRLGRDGVWVFGQDNVEPEEGSLWAVNPHSLKHGYSCWTRWEDYKQKKKNEKLGEAMVSMSTPLPDASTLRTYAVEGHPEDTWSYTDQLSIELTCVNGEDKGTTILYSTTSVGGINAIRDLIDAIMTQLDTDESRPVPVIELEVDSYNHKSYGKTYVPKLSIKQWAGLDQTEIDEEQEEEPEPEPAPKRKRTVAKQPEPEPETEEAEDDGIPDEQLTVAASTEGRVRRRRPA